MKKLFDFTKKTKTNKRNLMQIHFKLQIFRGIDLLRYSKQIIVNLLFNKLLLYYIYNV